MLSTGTIWVVPSDGTIVRTKLVLKGFSDLATPQQQREGAPYRPEPDPTKPTGGREAIAISESGSSMDTRLDESEATVEVAYAKDPASAVWLPASMSEFYEVPVKERMRDPVRGRATTRATYPDYRQFDTSATFKVK